jgi:threonine/homoserine/homoserine lactone efflux protein
VGQALGNVLLPAIAIAIFPIPIIAIVLLLGSDRWAAKGVAFVFAWCVGLTCVGAAVLLLADRAGANEGGEPAGWTNWLLVGLGVLLLGAAVKQWRGRPRVGVETPVPGWMHAIDRFTVAKAGVAGFALAGVNPKNVLLTVAAATEIADAGLPASHQAAVLLVFVLVASLGVLSPLVLSLALGERARKPLERLRGWMARHNSAMMAALFLLIGAKLIVDAISGFSS